MATIYHVRACRQLTFTQKQEKGGKLDVYIGPQQWNIQELRNAEDFPKMLTVLGAVFTTEESATIDYHKKKTSIIEYHISEEWIMSLDLLTLLQWVEMTSDRAERSENRDEPCAQLARYIRCSQV